MSPHKSDVTAGGYRKVRRDPEKSASKSDVNCMCRRQDQLSSLNVIIRVRCVGHASTSKSGVNVECHVSASMLTSVRCDCDMLTSSLGCGKIHVSTEGLMLTLRSDVDI